jgi:hypothetical protein
MYHVESSNVYFGWLGQTIQVPVQLEVSLHKLQSYLVSETEPPGIYCNGFSNKLNKWGPSLVSDLLIKLSTTRAAFNFSSDHCKSNFSFTLHKDNENISFEAKMYVCLMSSLLHLIVIPDIITGVIGLFAGRRHRHSSTITIWFKFARQGSWLWHRHYLQFRFLYYPMQINLNDCDANLCYKYILFLGHKSTPPGTESGFPALYRAMLSRIVRSF